MQDSESPPQIVELQMTNASEDSQSNDLEMAARRKELENGLKNFEGSDGGGGSSDGFNALLATVEIPKVKFFCNKFLSSKNLCLQFQRYLEKVPFLKIVLC